MYADDGRIGMEIGDVVMTKMERSVVAGRRFTALQRDWKRAGLTQAEQELACRQALGVNTRQARYDERVAELLQHFGDTPQDLTGILPTTLRDLKVKDVPADRTQRLAFYRARQESRPTTAKVAPRSMLGIPVAGVTCVVIERLNGTMFVATASERGRQVLTRLVGPLGSVRDLGLVLEGVVAGCGRLDVHDEAVNSKSLIPILSRLRARGCLVRFNPSAAIVVEPVSRWPKCESKPVKPIVKRAMQALSNALAGDDAHGQALS